MTAVSHPQSGRTMSRPAFSRLRARLAIGAALLLLPLGTLRAQPADLFPDAGWQFFIFNGLGTPTYPAEGFALTLARGGRVQLVAGGIIGNVFELFLDAATTPALVTSDPVDAGEDSGAGDGDAAEADPRLSHGTLALGPGAYTLRVRVRTLAPGTSDGIGFIKVVSTVVPEPGTLLLGGAGTLGLGLMLRARRRAR